MIPAASARLVVPRGPVGRGLFSSTAPRLQQPQHPDADQLTQSLAVDLPSLDRTPRPPPPNLGAPTSLLSWKYAKLGQQIVHIAQDDLHLETPAEFLPPTTEQKKKCLDGCAAAAEMAYFFSEAAPIYPITPSSPMGEGVDSMAAAGQKNLFGNTVVVTEMQSEAGAAGALHGLCTAGMLSSTYTASQGLLLMIPNLYKIAGELLPCVVHVAARALAGQGLSIFGEHSDVVTCRNTGFAMLCASSVQETVDFAAISHIASIQSSVPFMHFFDGFRTSHEIAKVSVPGTDILRSLTPWKHIQAFKDRAMNPNNPTLRGTAQSPDVFFQCVEAANRWHMAVPAELQTVMDMYAKETGRQYSLFDYYGHPNATDVIVLMGSAAQTAIETVGYLNEKEGKKTGVIVVRLYSPFDSDAFMAKVPESAQRICVLDRLKVPGGAGEPLFLDCHYVLKETNRTFQHIIGGRYGLGSKEFNPDHCLAVFENLALENPKQRFSVGINDDVTHFSLDVKPRRIATLPKSTIQCVFWGLGADGTVGANKEAAKIIANSTENFVQCYFDYDAKKSGGRTLSHLRFGPEPFQGTYMIMDEQADYVAVHAQPYVTRYDVLRYSKPGSTFLLNTIWSDEDIEMSLPANVKRIIAQRNLKFYAIDAYKVARAAGMGKRVNMILQTAFFNLSGVMKTDDAIALLKTSVAKVYKRKGQKVIDGNIAAIDSATEGLRLVKFNKDAWAKATDNITMDTSPAFLRDVVKPILAMEGDKLPVSRFQPDGFWPMGTTSIEKRGIAAEVPDYIADNCTQCGICAMVCPHAVIRPFLFSPEEAAAAPDALKGQLRKAIHTNPEVERFQWKIQVSPWDCTGCTLCVKACPDDALVMKEAQAMIKKEEASWNYAITLPNRGELFDRTTLKGAQMQQPLLEFSGACEGCGETPYVKLLTQICGERLIIANATGCSSIWGASVPAVPYTKNARGQGPAWANSLFEDNAEFGFGIATAVKRRTDTLDRDVKALLAGGSVKANSALTMALERWLALRDSKTMTDMQIASKMELLNRELQPLLQDAASKAPTDQVLQSVLSNKDYFTRNIVFVIGGDGWAFDIGFGGLDHVMASGMNINVLVLDTEVYSNTGGQASKATPRGAIAKFAEGTKFQRRKDLGELAMTYGSVYVASICLEANMTQAIKAFTEAINYTGTSLLLAYAPCIAMGFNLQDSMKHTRMAVDSGYWPLYRYNPDMIPAGQNPFTLDSKKIKIGLHEFLMSQNRFAAAVGKSPETKLESDTQIEFAHLKLHEMEFEMQKSGGKKAPEGGKTYHILYGSETGNAEGVARDFARGVTARGFNVVLSALDDIEVNELQEAEHIIVFCSTCGQGQFPNNAKGFYKAISNPDLGSAFFDGKTSFSVFGLGDSRYFCYCIAAKAIDKRLAELGAIRTLPLALGDDTDPDGYFTSLDEWTPKIVDVLHLGDAPLPTERPTPLFQVRTLDGGVAPAKVLPPGAASCGLKELSLQTDRKDRRVTYYRFDVKDKLQYKLGDSLAIYPENAPAMVDQALKLLGLKGTEVCEVTPTAAVKGNQATSLPDVLTSRQLCSQFLDFGAHPKKSFLGNLAMFCTDEKEKMELLWLAGTVSEFEGKGKPEQKQALKQLRDAFTNHLDILQKYKSAKLDLSAITSMMPVIQPRAYSIASSPLPQPTDIDLTVGLVDWTRGDGQYTKGLCTGHLDGITAPKLPTELPCTIRGSGIDIGTDPTVPIVMVALGTGIAPMRAICQERAALKKQGKAVGPLMLIYGAQHAATDWTFGEDFEQWRKEGILCCLDLAWSRDQAHKIYVHDKIKENGKLVAQMLTEGNGYLVLCGGTRSIPEGVKKAVRSALIKDGGLSDAEADTTIENIGLAGRWIVEAWG